ncbi:MAG TPA: family 16 glycoside hydrolase [Chryseolinea sp.]|nr:family 16 glycoside hydrolase [Chryseolinea sp.]
MKTKLSIVLAILVTYTCLAQTKIDLRDVKQFTVENRKIESVIENGRQVLKLSEAPGDGLAIVNDMTFENGTIEFDVKGRNVMQQSFVGLAFHVQDRSTYEAVYFRPFNFVNADTARRRRAVQYIAMPDYPWEKLREQHPGKYESKVSPVPEPDAWFHVKVVVEDKNVRVYVDNSASPSLQVERLSNSQSGKLAMWTGHGSNGSFADLVITNTPKKTPK